MGTEHPAHEERNKETPRHEEEKTMTFRAEVRQLLNILAHSLYTEREIFLRELISNASDALNRVQFEMLTNQEVRDPEAELAIHIEVDEKNKTITIKDSGIGMTRSEIIENLGTIAQSGARLFIEQLNREQHPDTDVIGQFGVGFYSVFMVAKRVVVTSLSYRPDAEAVQWEATGDDTYVVRAAQRESRGTTIEVHLKDDATEFASPWRIRQIIRKHSDFIAFPIMMGGERINQQKALWRRAPREVEPEQYTAFYKQLTLDTNEPLHVIHLSTDVPVDLHALLFIPSRRERGILERSSEGKVRLYSHSVLIQEDAKDLLPTHYRFLEVIIDSEDIPLNVSRESVQSNPVLQRIRKAITSRVNKELHELSEKEPEKYARFWREFGVFIKEGIAVDFTERDELIRLLRFYTTHSPDTLTSLADYKGRIVEGQDQIYYVVASDQESARLSPHLDPMRARNIEVIFLTDMIDGFMLSGLRQYEGMKLTNVDDAHLRLPGESPKVESAISDEEFAVVQKRFREVLGERVKEVRASTVLREHPIRLVSPDNTPGREMQRIQHLLGREVTMPPRILELNRAHPLIVGMARRLTKQADDPVVSLGIEQLYDNALLLEGLLTNPAAMVPRIQSIIEASVCPEEHETQAG